MLETTAALLLAHMLADFVLQSDAMVRNKRHPRMMALHGAIVTAAAWAALGFPAAPWLILLIAASHLAIDLVKVHALRPDLRAFLLDQAAHVVVIAIAAALFPGAYGAGLWAVPPTWLAAIAGPWLIGLPWVMALVAGLIATTLAGGHAMRLLMLGFKASGPIDVPGDGIPKAGQMIGLLERILIFILVLMDQTDAIGFLIAAKSVLRFSEIQQDRLASEYVIIGTLASFAWALAIAWATGTLAASVGGP